MKPRPSIAIVTQSERMRAILARVETIARSDTSVLLIGETGVGKQMFADYIHRVSARSEMWFFVVFSMIHMYLVFYDGYVGGRGVISSMAGGWKFVERRKE